MNSMCYYPTYEEMLYPEKIDNSCREKAIKALKKDELNSINLFNITWKDKSNKVRKLVLPKELTGVNANILVLLGNDFPSGSHKVGPAYATLIESYLDGNMIPGKHTLLAPSTGNFGIGAAYICKLMGYDSIVVMPENVSNERHERIKKYGGKLSLTPPSESDVIFTLEKTYELAKNNSNYRVLAQFEFFSNYRFHRYVTGNSAIEAAKNIGNGKIACFCSAPGSGGTLAAGDEIKKVFSQCQVTAVEPFECSTLSNGRRGQHRIEGIGDKMCTLIHNVLNTDYIACIKEKEAMLGFKILHDYGKALEEVGVSSKLAQYMKNIFGPSGICNILGAIKMAKYLNLGSDDNVVTIATDGFDRYGSVLKKLNKEFKEDNNSTVKQWIKDVFLNQDINEIYDFRSSEAKERLYKQKEKDWLHFGHSKEYLDSMRTMNFWDREYVKINDYNEKIKKFRNKHMI
ncbi:PLP-dependent cysteine synthase family protein [Clostridium ganghwense]|uniref:Pyridoxal-phosphate dependent enzyme n=1 Tax=Clostridium ganghwense TaxID=312089 RepID=A0ABT4CUG0_9CLOT|nr:pyridoxal-phosphate dependent enzyme [Clostridium ganghwense]MCY6371594.1 pyridoxal-phosphate dependent enzyme [Clostridium ganghwense]